MRISFFSNNHHIKVRERMDKVSEKVAKRRSVILTDVSWQKTASRLKRVCFYTALFLWDEKRTFCKYVGEFALFGCITDRPPYEPLLQTYTIRVTCYGTSTKLK